MYACSSSRSGCWPVMRKVQGPASTVGAVRPRGRKTLSTLVASGTGHRWLRRTPRPAAKPPPWLTLANPRVHPARSGACSDAGSGWSVGEEASGGGSRVEGAGVHLGLDLGPALVADQVARAGFER